MKSFKTALYVALTTIIYVSIAWWAFQFQIDSYHNEIRSDELNTKNLMDFCIDQAIDEELQMRVTLPEANFKTEFNTYKKPDSSDYVVKTVETMDTTFQVRILKYDLGAIFRIQQYILKDFLPVNLSVVENLFRSKLENNHITPDVCYLEYVDIKKDLVINHSPSEKPKDIIASDIVPLDILKTVGVKAYISKSENPSILKTRKDFLIDLIVWILMYIGVICAIIYRKKIKKMFS